MPPLAFLVLTRGPHPCQLGEVQHGCLLEGGAQSCYVGIIARDSASVCIAMRSLKVSASSAAMAKALAVLEGCLLAKNLQLQKMVIESNAQDIIRSLNSAFLSCVWELFPILSRVREVEMTFQVCSWS